MPIQTLCWYYLAYWACLIKHNRVARVYRRDHVAVWKDARPPTEGDLGLQPGRIYFLASQTSSRRRFIQWLGCGS